jgi:signal transduction histidine kinase
VAEEQLQSELLAILAHEIRNPLAGIIGYADIGEGDDLGPAATEIFGHIRTDADRLRRLVDNVLELARHESGNVDWSMVSLDVRALVDDLVRAYTPQCDLKNLLLRTNYDGLSRSALGNPDRIMQVLSNLLSNAVKFTADGGVIEIRACVEAVAANDPESPPIPAHEIDAWAPIDPTDDRRQFVRIDVSDTGPGMTEEVRERLFHKFSQGGTRQRTRGVGLGLYISRNIVLRHGGSIFVRSTIGQGSTFSVRIPVAPS